MTPEAATPLHDFPDRVLRSLLENWCNLRDLVERAAPLQASRLAFERAVLQDRSFLLPDLRSRGLDLLFKVPCRDAAEQEWLICLLIEHQSQPDPRIALRVLLYATLYWEREWRTWENQHDYGAPLQLTPILPIVFHTGPATWQANRSLADMMAFPPDVAIPTPSWDLIFWEVAAESAEDLCESRREFIAAMALIRAEREDGDSYRRIYAEVLKRIEPLCQSDRHRWKELLGFVLEWSLRRRPRNERPEFRAIAVDRHRDAERKREVQEMNATLEVGMDKEIFDRGVAQGVAQGVARGEIQARRADVMLLLEDRFGPIPSELRRQIDAIEDPTRLAAVLRQIIRIRSLTELQL